MRQLRLRARERRVRKVRRAGAMLAKGRKGSGAWGATALSWAADGRGRRGGWQKGLVVLMALATGVVLLVRERERDGKGIG